MKKWTWEMTRDFDGSATRADIGPAENAELKMGVIPGHRRIYDDGVEVWPGNHGAIPEDWDGVYLEKARHTYRTRSGRSRRR